MENNNLTAKRESKKDESCITVRPTPKVCVGKIFYYSVCYSSFAKTSKQNLAILDQCLITGFQVGQGLIRQNYRELVALFSHHQLVIRVIISVFGKLIQLPWMNLKRLTVVDFGPGILLRR